VPYARLEALKHVSDSSNIILCLDGDSIPASNWVEVMSNILRKGNTSLVGSLVLFKGPVISSFMNMLHRVRSSRRGIDAVQWIWGPSFGFPREYLSQINRYLELSITMQSKLKLVSSLEDYIRAHYLFANNSAVSVELTNKTYVYTYVKEKTSIELIQRTRTNLSDKEKVDTYFSH